MDDCPLRPAPRRSPFAAASLAAALHLSIHKKKKAIGYSQPRRDEAWE